MVKVAILEYEKETKEIAYALCEYYKDLDWTFRHFFKASDLARALKDESYQVFFFDELFKSPRTESVFVHDNPGALIVYLCQDPSILEAEDDRERVLYLSKANLSADLNAVKDKLIRQARQKESYSFYYNGVKIDIPVEDIYYMEKVEKNVVFHTRKGTFHRRLNLSELEEDFAKYGFLRAHVSYIVNSKYITAIYKDEIELNHEMRVPLSRQQKKKLGLKARKS